MSEIGKPRQFKNPILDGLRSWPVTGFEDILIFYIAQPDALRVVRILEGVISKKSSKGRMTLNGPVKTLLPWKTPRRPALKARSITFEARLSTSVGGSGPGVGQRKVRLPKSPMRI